MRTFMALMLVSCGSLFGQGVIATVAGGAKALPSGNLPPLQTPIVPVSIALGPSGDLYFSDQPSSSVLRLSREGSLSVVAGNGAQGFSGDGGPATSAAMSGPKGVAVDADGNLYIADSNNHRVRKVSAVDGVISTVAGTGQVEFAGDGGPAKDANLRFPLAVAVARDGTLFIVDSGVFRIRRVTPAGIISTYAGNGASQSSGDGGPATSASFVFAQDIAVDAAGNVYISDAAGQKIRRVDTAGIISTVAGNGTFGFSGDDGPATAASLANPRGISVAANGTLYIADSESHRIRRVAPGGTISTVTGNLQPLFSGDGGLATRATVSRPQGVVADSAGRIYVADTGNARLRQIDPAGVITTITGNGAASALQDGSPATTAGLSAPGSLATDPAGNLYIADFGNQRVRRVAPDGTIRTAAGTGEAGFSGDGGPAVQAKIAEPAGVATDRAGNLYIADRYHNRVRRVTPAGVISTFAGTGEFGSSGDGAAATAARLAYPAGLAIDASNNLYVSEQGSSRIRRISAAGIISTIAGNGTPGFSGDGGPATEASLNTPAGLAFDAAGNLYIADSANQRIRMVSPSGRISTVAGGGTTLSDGDLATKAILRGPQAVAVDAAGTLYIADSQASRVRRVDKNGIITTFAGTGESGFSGDGDLASNAKIEVPSGLAIDAAGNLYISDRNNNRVRVVLASPPSFLIGPTSLTFSASAGASPTAGQFVAVSPGPKATGLAFTASTSESWLQLNLTSGNMPSRLEVIVDPASLSAGNYTGKITVNSPYAARPVQEVAVEVTVSGSLAPQLSIEQTSLTFGAIQGSAATSQLVRVKNIGSGNLSFRATAATVNGGSWLSISPASGSVVPSRPGSFAVTADPGALAPGTYTGTISVASSPEGQVQNLSVIMSVAAGQPVILLSQTGLTFNAVQGAFAEPPQTFGVLNIGQGTLTWKASVTGTPGENWLSVTPASGASDAASLTVPLVQVSVNPDGLRAGQYYGQVVVSGDRAVNSPQYVSVVLNVLPPDSNPGPVVRPTGLIFTSFAGAGSPGSQLVGVANLTSASTSFISSQLPYGKWLDSSPVNSVVQPGTIRQVVVQPDVRGLGPGVQRGAITLLFNDDQTRVVNVLLVVAAQPGRTTGRSAEGDCTPTQLSLLSTALSSQFRIQAGWPVTVSAKVVDDCGQPLISGAVTASFSNGDPSVPLTSLKDGNWLGTWAPRNSVSPQTTVAITAEGTSQNLKATLSVNGSVGANTGPPLLEGGSDLLAPGGLIVLKGTGLANRTEIANTSPLETVLGETSILIGTQRVPLLYASDGQVNGLVPFGIAPNVPHSMILRRGQVNTNATKVTVAASLPAIFTKDQTGSGQGLVFDLQNRIVDQSSPVKAGDAVVIYCTGLGEVSPAVPSGFAAPAAEPLSRTVAPVSVTIAGAKATVLYAGLAPGFVGLYQVNAIVPETGAPTGLVDVTVSAGEQQSPPVKMGIQ